MCADQEAEKPEKKIADLWFAEAQNLLPLYNRVPKLRWKSGDRSESAVAAKEVQTPCWDQIASSEHSFVSKHHVQYLRPSDTHEENGKWLYCYFDKSIVGNRTNFPLQMMFWFLLSEEFRV